MPTYSDVAATQFAPAERLEKQDVQQQQDFVLSLDNIRFLLNLAPMPVIILNAQRQIVMANAAVVKMLGTEDADPFVGKRPGEALNCVHAYDFHNGCGTSRFCSTCGAVRAVLSSQKGKPSGEICRINVKNKESILALELEIWAIPFSEEDNNFTIVFLRDVSEAVRKRLLERIFFHDLLNTITILTSYIAMIELCNEKEQMNAAMLYVKEIEKTAERLTEEIRAQKDLLSAENGELVITFKEVTVDKKIRDICQLSQAYEFAKEIKYDLDPKSEGLVIKTDEVLFTRVLNNMLKNAFEASEKGDKVTVYTKMNGSYLDISVQNEGIIPEKTQLQLFQRSFSTKGKDRGLGTYSMKLLTEKYLQGKIYFISNELLNTIFTISLPLKLKTNNWSSIS